MKHFVLFHFRAKLWIKRIIIISFLSDDCVRDWKIHMILSTRLCNVKNDENEVRARVRARAWWVCVVCMYVFIINIELKQLTMHRMFLTL